MHRKRIACFRKLSFGFMWGLLLMVLLSMTSGSSIVRAQEVVPAQYGAANVADGKLQSLVDYSASTITLPDGSVIQKIIAGGPPKPPSGFEMQRRQVTLPKPDGKTTNIVETSVGGGGGGVAPAYVAGCASTSAGDVAGFYDRGNYPNMYNGPTNGGVMPMDNSLWPTWTDVAGDTYSNNPLIASHMGVDGRTTRGTLDDYWVSYFSGLPDPYINHWPEHAWGDAVADYMYTSQSKYGNDDGETAFYIYQQGGAPYTCDTMAKQSLPDGALGLKNFYNARGYSVTACYNQPTDNFRAGGFTFAQLRAEIDGGRPAILGISDPAIGGHTVVAVGYDTPTNTVYIHDGWDFALHTMTWGGSYAGMTMQTVTIVNLAPSADIAISGNVGVAGATISYIDITPKTTQSDANGNFTITVPTGWSGTITPTRTGFTFTPGSISYTNAASNLTGQNFIASWVGAVKVEANRNVVAVGRPHVGAEVASYDGFSSGSLTSY
ncbi:MAG: C39 family peptidase, partial [Bacteroidota bacterium]